MAIFEVGAAIVRLEGNTAMVKATVVSVSELQLDKTMYLISYEEGGQGYWPESSLEAE